MKEKDHKNKLKEKDHKGNRKADTNTNINDNNNNNKQNINCALSKLDELSFLGMPYMDEEN